MRVSIVKIGNSGGIRIPEMILEQCRVESEVGLEVRDGKIVLDPRVGPSRAGWEEWFARMAERDDDRLPVDDGLDADIEEWEW